MKYLVTQSATYEKKLTESENIVLENLKAHYDFVDNNGKKMTMDLKTVDNIPMDSKVIPYSQLSSIDWTKSADTFYVRAPEVNFRTDYKIDEEFNKDNISALCDSFAQYNPIEADLGNNHFSSFVQFDVEVV